MSARALDLLSARPLENRDEKGVVSNKSVLHIVSVPAICLSRITPQPPAASIAVGHAALRAHAQGGGPLAGVVGDCQAR